MAASFLTPSRPLTLRTQSSKHSNPYETMNKVTSPTTPHGPDFIAPGVYLTDLITARQTLSLPTTTHPDPIHPHPPIKYILSLLDNSLSQPHAKPPTRQSLFTQHLILLDDLPTSDLLAVLNPAIDWIDDSLAKNDGAVLVHCRMGQSRSAAVVVAWVMRTRKLDVDAAIERVKRKRGCVRINEGFVRQLRLWEGMGMDVWEDVKDGEGDNGNASAIQSPMENHDATTTTTTDEPTNLRVQTALQTIQTSHSHITALKTAIAELERKIEEELTCIKVNTEIVREITGKLPDGVAIGGQNGGEDGHGKTVVSRRRRKAAYEAWRVETDRKTKGFLEDLV